MFAFGFYIMDKVDHFLNDNYSRLEVMEHTSALRIAMEDSSIAGSLSDLLEEFSKTNPDCDIYFMTGNIHEIQDVGLSNILDSELCRRKPAEGSHR